MVEPGRSIKGILFAKIQVCLLAVGRADWFLVLRKLILCALYYLSIRLYNAFSDFSLCGSSIYSGRGWWSMTVSNRVTYSV